MLPVSAPSPKAPAVAAAPVALPGDDGRPAVGAPLMTDLPVIETVRLTLRKTLADDLLPADDGSLEARSARMRALGGNGTRRESMQSFLSGVSQWQMRDVRSYTILETATGAACGHCGLLPHADWSETELTYRLFDGFEGRGLAYEACVALRHSAGHDMGLPPLVSCIAPENARSLALAHRLGAVEIGTRRFDGEWVLVYRHLGHDAPLARAQWSEVTR